MIYMEITGKFLNILVDFFSRVLIVSGTLIGLTENSSVFKIPAVFIITVVLLTFWILNSTGIKPFSDKEESEL